MFTAGPLIMALTLPWEHTIYVTKGLRLETKNIHLEQDHVTKLHDHVTASVPKLVAAPFFLTHMRCQFGEVWYTVKKNHSCSSPKEGQRSFDKTNFEPALALSKASADDEAPKACSDDDDQRPVPMMRQTQGAHPVAVGSCTL